MESSKISRKRRSMYGNCQSLFTPNKSLRHSITDRLKYKYKNFTDEENGNYHPDALILITKHNWNLHRVSHLRNVKCSTVKLKQYAARIRNELIKNIKDTKENVTFSAKVKMLPDLKDSDKDPSSLIIEVFYKKNDDQPVLKYRGVLLSWGNNNSPKWYIQLPLLLCVGAINTTRIVHNTLHSLFDTIIRPLRITEDDLMWMSAMLSHSDSNRKESINYNFSLHGSDKNYPIIVTLPFTVIKDLWSHIHPYESEDIGFQEVQNFNKHLHDQLQVIYGINFNLLKLNKVEMCDATITCEGKIKIYDKDAAVTILHFINDLSLILDSASPHISAEITNNFL